MNGRANRGAPASSPVSADAAGMTVYVGPSASHLGEGLRAALAGDDVDLFAAEARTFPDGETCVDLGAQPCRPLAVIVQGTHAPQDTHLHQLYQLVEVARHKGARAVACVLPYFGYGRQDRRFSDGQAATATMVFRLLSSLGCSRVLTYDIHNPRAAAETGVILEDLHAADLLAGLVAERDRSALAWVAPDLGARERAGRAAARMGGQLIQLTKTKEPDGTTYYLNQDAPIDGKDCFVIDDVCSTGSTLVPLARFLASHGARRITYFATHFFAEPDSIRRRAQFDIEILSANTAPNPCAALSVEAHLARRLRELKLEDGRVVAPA